MAQASTRNPDAAAAPRGRETLSGVPDGHVPLVLAQLTEEAAASAREAPALLHVARDDRRLEAIAEGLAFFAPNVRVVSFPAWDTVPYDRIGPNSEIVSRRIAGLARLAATSRKDPTLVLTTVNAILQRVAPREFIRRSIKTIAPGQRLDMGQLTQRLNLSGFTRTGTVMEPGEYAVRGGILDLFPPGRTTPVRLDFFGDTLEHIKAFDPDTQRTTRIVQRVSLLPISEVAFGEAPEKLFRRRYVEAFGPVKTDDPLYEAVSAGQRYPGMEHWLPLFHEHVETLFDYLPDAPVSFDHLADEAVAQRLELIRDHYEARAEGLETQTFGVAPYKPVPPEAMFLSADEWSGRLDGRLVRYLTPFEKPDVRGTVRSMEGRTGRVFAAERASEGGNVFQSTVAHVRRLQGQGRRVILATFTAGARERLATLLAEHDLADAHKVETYAEALALPAGTAAHAVLGLEQGFETPDLAVIAEQDILGDRLTRPRRKTRRAADLITEATSLSVGDLVVHADHGIGRFDGLTTITALGHPHDCLEIGYAGGDKLYLPVENIELLSRYGSGDGGEAQLDKLGGVGWQHRKARLKQRIREIASELIKVAALRQLREGTVVQPPAGEYDEFVARFPYEETDDQDASIQAVLDDLASGKPMDRLVCGDVGFGKTEVALRAAYVAAMAGLQVAVVVPTTLLARQHLATFTDRFKGLPVRVAQASRLVNPKDAGERQGRPQGRQHRHRGGHPCSPCQGHRLRPPGAHRRGRGAALRRRPQGAAEAAARGGACPHPHRHTDPAYPPARPLRRARDVGDRHAADRPPGGTHLHLAVRSRHHPRGLAARALPRRTDLLRGAAHRRPGGGAGVPDRAYPGAQARHRPRPDAAHHAGGRDDGVLRGQIRRAALNRDHRIRPRHPQCQHARRAPRRHVRPRPALSAEGPRRPLQDARLRLLHGA